jgi:hypothetical protein
VSAVGGEHNPGDDIDKGQRRRPQPRNLSRPVLYTEARDPVKLTLFIGNKNHFCERPPVQRSACQAGAAGQRYGPVRVINPVKDRASQLLKRPAATMSHIMTGVLHQESRQTHDQS